MSTVSAEAPDGEQRAALTATWQRRIALILLLVALTALLRVETASVPDDLLLTAPAEAFAGSCVPIRIHLLRHVDAPSGPALGPGRVRVRLADLAGTELAWALAEGDPELGLRASLRIPEQSRGTLRVDAWELADAATSASQPERGALRVSRALTVVSSVTPAFLPREALPLQRGALGRVRSEPGARPPDPFLPRILGGVCVPEEPCDVLVWRGEPAVSLTLVPGMGAEIVADFPAAQGAGLVLARLRVHGPEAELTLRATRDGGVVASRSMRLPVALGRAYLGPITVSQEAASLDFSLPPGRKRGIADGFLNDAWIASVDIQAATGRLSLPIPRGAHGVLRVQVRGDAFSAEGSGARQTIVGESDLPTSLRMLWSNGAARDEGSALSWQRDLPVEIARTPALALQFAAALAEEDALGVPAPARARPAITTQMARGKLRVRWAFALAVLCAAMVVALALMRRGLGAAREAASVLAEHEQPAALGARLEVVLWALGVALAFAAAALLIVAKPLWF